MIKMYKNLPKNLRKNTFNQILKLFSTYGFKYEFKRDDIENILEVKKSRSSEILSLLIDNELIYSCAPAKYMFKK